LTGMSVASRRTTAPARWTTHLPLEALCLSPAVVLSTLAVAIFCLALFPRLLARDLFPTSDEDSWMRRSGGFAYGLLNGQLGRTYQNGHPGVTTMWTAALAQGPENAVRFADRVHELRFVAQVPGYLEALAQARIGFAVVAAAGVAVSMALVFRLFGLGVALIAGLGLAAEPFLVANTQLVHVDGPLTTLASVAVLAALVRWTAGGGRWALALSGIAAGLALLSKSPALSLFAFVPLLAVASPGRGAWTVGSLGAILLDLCLWLAISLATVAALWPALWALGPAEVLRRVVEFTRETGGQPDEVGSFFLGQVGADPGPLYYPVAALFRLSPFALIGLVLLVVLVTRLPDHHRRPAAWLALFLGGFALMMALGPKKFDRYLLPIFPGLVVLAALGWSLVVTRLGAAPARIAASAGLVILLVWPLASVHPYPLSYYNPLIGGGSAAQRAVMVGNGEGLDQAARWLAAQPGAEHARVAAHSFDILAAMIPGDGEPLRDGIPDDADYVVTYGRRIQMQRWGPSLDRYLQANPPLHSVWINGIEYVRIHPGPHLGRSS
jgi:Dolichyl-phosphate-mannose-protein mannosyltransferase